MFKKKRHVSEDFDVGKANMETPNYEIKINGQVPIDYATAINDRQKRIDKIEKDFENMLKINGATTLSHLMRAYVATNTSLSGMQTIMLPLINFVEFFKESKKENKSDN